MNRSAWEWWSASILFVVFVVFVVSVVVGISAGWGWAFLTFGVGLFVSLVVSESRRPVGAPGVSAEVAVSAAVRRHRRRLPDLSGGVGRAGSRGR